MRRHSPLASIALLAALGGAAASLAAGCSSDEPRPRPAATKSYRSQLEASDLDYQGDRAVVAVRKIVTAPEGVILGYLQVRESPGETRTNGDPQPIVKKPFRVNWVCDMNWKSRGFYTDEGWTYVFARDGALVDQGRHGVDDAKLIILGKSERQAIELREMDPPRTLEGDREKAAADKAAKAAAAKAAAEKAAKEGAGGEKKSE